MTTKKRENYQDFHERMEKKRVRAKKVKQVRKWRAWLVNFKDCKLTDTPLFYFKKPLKMSDEWVIVPVEIREVRR